MAVVNIAGGYASQNQEVGDNFVYFAMNQFMAFCQVWKLELPMWASANEICISRADPGLFWLAEIFKPSLSQPTSENGLLLAIRIPLISGICCFDSWQQSQKMT